MSWLIKPVAVCDLKVDDWIDLEGDVFADPMRDSVVLASEYQQIEAIEVETEDCILVYLASHSPIGFPKGHWVRLAIEQTGEDA